MEKQDIIKYVAIAAGAYLIYTFVRDQGYLDGLFGAKTAAPGKGATPPVTGATPPAATPPAANPPTAPPPTAPPPTAPPPTAPTGTTYTGNLGQRLSTLLGPGRKQLTADAWNYYTTVVTGVKQTADLFDPDNRDALMSMSEYFTRRTAAGLDNETTFGMSGYSGYSGGMGDMGNYSPWLT